jgi:hypothetical protein
VQRGAAEAVVAVTGSGFLAQSVVRLDGADRPTEYVSDNELRVRLAAADLAAARTAEVTVFTPAPGGGASAALALTIANPAPAIASLAPGTVAAASGGATVTVTGTGFVPQSGVRLGPLTRTTTYVSATELRVELRAEDLAAPGRIQLTVVNPAPGGGASGTAELAVDNPAPTLASLSPDFLTTGESLASVRVVGTGFVPQSQVFSGVTPRQTTYVSPTELRVTFLGAEMAAAGSLELRVENPAPGGGTSGTVTLELRAPAPVIGILTDTVVTAGGSSFELGVNGSGFAANSEVRLNGSARPTRRISATRLDATLYVTDLQEAASYDVTVTTPAPGGGTSNTKRFQVINPDPVILSISPGFVTTGGAGATITVVGMRFVPQSQVMTGAAPRQTAYVSPTELRVTLSEAEVAAAGTLELRVQNPAPGGGISNPASFQLRSPVPAISSLDPAHALDRQLSMALRVNGTGFAANSEVHVDGSARPTRRLSATQLEATLNMGDLEAAGTFPVTVFTPGPGGGTSGALSFEVRAPVPAATSLAPAQGIVGRAVTLRVNGTGFRAGSQVRVGGAARPTTVVSATQLDATLSAADLRTVGTLEITAATPAPGGGTSGALQFQVVNPAPRISLLPSRGASAGRQGFTLAVHGSGFVAGTVVRWNGSDRPTTFINESRVLASITSGDVASPGTAQVTVHTPAPGGGTSAAVAMQVRAVPAAVITSTRRVEIPARDLVWSAATGRLYASVPSSVPTYGNSVIAIDPATGTVTGSAFVGSNPGALGLSGNGDVLYVSLEGSNSVRRVALPGLVAGLEFSVGEIAADIAVMPGRPNTIAVSRRGPHSHKDVCIYDEGTRRPQCTTFHTWSNSIEFAVDGSELYGYNNQSTDFGFRTIAISADGLRETRVTEGLISGFGVDIRSAAGRVYGDDGSVVDPERHVRVGRLEGWFGSVAPDPTLGRVFLLERFGSTLSVFDMNHFTSLGSLTLDGLGTRLIRWGSDGLAFHNGEGIHIFRIPLAGP